MCGVAGAILETPLGDGLSGLLTSSLAHRGPDAAGEYTARGGRLVLGHRRLSVLDLSADANQPMASADGRYVIVYNGEVYNYPELRKEYLKDVSLRTHGDTEVVLALYAKYGARCIAWLNGMFALAIHDRERDELFLCRDGIGIKPLFYYAAGPTVVFASELKAVRTFVQDALGKTLRVAEEAIPKFLHLGFIPEPLTIYEQVFKFPAGHHATIALGQTMPRPTPFWRADDSFLRDPIADEETAYARYKALLFDAVGKQMIADVPLGTFLSGGIDSSLVTAVAAQLSTRPIKTFSIGFDDPHYDESRHAAAVASHLKTEHHPFVASVEEVRELVPSLLETYDEPFSDSSAFPTMLVSRLARQHVTVTLSGDGGDELFQGYGMYNWASRLAHPLAHIARKPLYAVSRHLSPRLQRAGTLFDYEARSRLRTHIFSQEQYYFSERELRELLTRPSFDLESANALDTPEAHGMPHERQAFWDFTHYLKDDLLVKVDRASMRSSLETRVPLLDTPLVEFALNLSADLKVREGWGSKYLMKRVLYDMVPRRLFERPKRGFSIPLQQWLLGPLAHLIDDHLSPTVVRRYGYVRPESVVALVRQFRNGQHRLYNRVWSLVVLHWWLSQV